MSDEIFLGQLQTQTGHKYIYIEKELAHDIASELKELHLKNFPNIAKLIDFMESV